MFIYTFSTHTNPRVAQFVGVGYIVLCEYMISKFAIPKTIRLNHISAKKRDYFVGFWIIHYSNLLTVNR